MAGYVYTISLSRKKELISRCVVARRSARSIFFFALQTRAFHTFRSTVGVRLRLENYKNPLES